jgi:hypothetical protein
MLLSAWLVNYKQAYTLMKLICEQMMLLNMAGEADSVLNTDVSTSKDLSSQIGI